MDDDAEYIVYQDPTKEALYSRVEYDIDEQDEAWLKSENYVRKQNGQCLIDYDLFERVMDRIEKEWFNLTRDQVQDHPDDDESNECSVCGDGECENSNAIVFCDGCNVAVHQDCYGVPYIPEGQWFCRRCMISPDSSVRCIFCPVEDGAFKQTDTGKWAHVLCAIWIPECAIGNYTFMEPITDVTNIPRSRWRLFCYLCRQRCGAPIQCSNKNCYVPFHASCARKAGLYMKMRGQMGQSNNSFRVYCDKHTPVCIN